MEQWRKIEGQEHIEVSTLGNVRAKEGYKIQKNLCKTLNNSVQIVVSNRKTWECYRFMLHLEVIKFRIQDYDTKKMIWLNGNRTDCSLENLSDARKSKYFKHNAYLDKINEVKKTKIDKEEPLKKVSIYQHELREMSEFNSKASDTINKLKKENEHLKKEINKLILIK